MASALRHVFDTPSDPLLWDVGHQSYPRGMPLALENTVEAAMAVAEQLTARGYSTTVADARFAKPIDEELAENHRLLITLEEGAAERVGYRNRHLWRLGAWIGSLSCWRMMMRASSLLLAVMVLVGLAAPLRADDGAARQTIQSFSDTLLDVMKQAKTLGYQGRLARLDPAIKQAYDIPAMTIGALGPPAKKLSPQELARLSDSFSRYTVATYAEQFDGFDGEHFEVDQPRPSTNGSVVVPSKIVPRTGDATEIDYVMHQDGDSWKIIDVLLEGTVSQVAVRRSEFGSIYRANGLDGLIQLMDQKTAAMDK